MIIPCKTNLFLMWIRLKLPVKIIFIQHQKDFCPSILYSTAALPPSKILGEKERRCVI